MDPKKLVLLAAAIALPFSVLGQTPAPQVKTPNPGVYTVVPGDTLWDISGRFLQQPWLWPEVWQLNPQIKDPHLIYPGDEIALEFKDGVPRLRLRRGRRYVKLSPRARPTPIDQAIPTIPIDEIHQFLSRPRVVTTEDIEGAPYILSAGRESLVAAPGEHIFARGIADDRFERFTVYREGQVYTTESGEVIGLEAIHVGDAILLEAGDPSTLTLTSVTREVLAGDRLFPVTREEIDTHFTPRAPAGQPKGQIVAVFDGVTQIGQHQIVVTDLGERDGIEPGHVLSVFQRGETMFDPLARPAGDDLAGRRHLETSPRYQGGVHGGLIAADDYVVNISDSVGAFLRQFRPLLVEPYQQVHLPDEHAGVVMVFRSFDNLSYALVMNATRAMHVYDVLRTPENL